MELSDADIHEDIADLLNNRMTYGLATKPGQVCAHGLQYAIIYRQVFISYLTYSTDIFIISV